MLSLVLGVVAMHATIACRDDARHGQNVAMHGPAAVPMTMTGLDGSAAVATDTPAAPRSGSVNLPAGSHSGPPAAATEVFVVTTRAVLLAADLAEPTGPDGGHSALHDLLHLCLAVLTGLLALAAAALLAFLVRRAVGPHTVPRSARPVAGPRAPPPISVRLAQLCVLRN